MSADEVVSSSVSEGRATAPLPADPEQLILPNFGPVGPDPLPPEPAKRRRGRPRKDADAGPPPPPKGTAPKGAAGGRPSTAEATEKRIAREMAATYRMVGKGLALAGSFSLRAHVMSTVIAENADEIGAAYGRWAASNPKVAQMLDRVSFGGGVVDVIFAHGPLLFALQASDQSKAAGATDEEAEMMAQITGQLGGFLANMFDQNPPAPDAPT